MDYRLSALDSPFVEVVASPLADETLAPPGSDLVI
jgi:hypothetical protein